MQFQYDPQKNKENLEKHGVDFEVASSVFDDPYALTIRDEAHSDQEERYITLGEIGPGAVLFVVHTMFADENGEEIIRLISARAATSKERKAYEETHQRAAKANRRHRREKGQRH